MTQTSLTSIKHTFIQTVKIDMEIYIYIYLNNQYLSNLLFVSSNLNQYIDSKSILVLSKQSKRIINKFTTIHKTNCKAIYTYLHIYQTC